MAKLTPEQACINYAVVAEEMRKLTAIIRVRCESYEKGDCGDPGVPRCVDALREIDQGYPGWNDQYEDMCQPCKDRWQAYQDRKDIRKKLNSAKRAVLSVGKTLRKSATGTAQEVRDGFETVSRKG